MNPLRPVTYGIGAVLVCVAGWLFFVERMSNWIPVGIVIAASILIVGMFIMGLPEKRGNRTMRRRGNINVVKRRLEHDVRALNRE